MTRNKNNISNKNYSLLLVFLIIDLFLIYFLKYKNQSLTLSDFNLAAIGNAANLIFYILMILGLSIILKGKSYYIDIKLFNLVFIINQLSIAACYATTIINLPFDKFYYMTQGGNRLFTGFIFTFYQFTFFVLLFLVWLNILKVKNLILLRAILNTGWLMLLLLIFSFIFIIISEHNLDSDGRKRSVNSIAIVLGAAVWSDNKPSPTLAARVDKSLELYDKGIVSSIFLTGGNAPGELSESEVALNYIRSKKKMTENIFIETKTTSTTDQIKFIKSELLSNRKAKNVVVVSDSYHLVRTKEISDFHNIKINVVASGLPLSFEKALYFKVRESIALIIFWFFAL